jgi:capsid protein
MNDVREIAVELAPMGAGGGAPSMPVALGHGGFSGVNDSPARGRIWFPHVRQAEEIAPWERREAARQARWMQGNGGLAERIINGMSLHVCGRGFRARPLSADKDWNRLVKDAFHRHASSAEAFDRAGRVNFYEAQVLVERQNYLTGEMFGLLTESEVSGRAMMAFYEAEQVGNPSDRRVRSAAGDEDVWRDGIRLNRDRRPVGYRFLTEVKGEFEDMDARDVIHYYDYTRPGQRRGITKFLHALNHLKDVMETRGFIKHGIKARQSVGYYIKTLLGGTPTGLDAGMGSLLDSEWRKTVDEMRSNVPTQEFFGGGEIGSLGVNQSLETIQHDSPGGNEQSFEGELLREVALGFGVFPELLFYVAKMSNQTSRLALEDLQKLLDYRQPRLARIFCTRYYLYWLSKELKAGRLPMPVVVDESGEADWWKHGWLVPRKVTLDAGRDGKLELQQVEEGLLTLSEFFGCRGRDWQDEVTQQIDEVKFRMGRIYDAIAEDPRLRVEDFLPGRGSGPVALDPAAGLVEPVEEE